MRTRRGTAVFRRNVHTGRLVQLAGGRKIEFSDHLMLNSFNRTILVRKERIDGPQYD